MKIARQLIKFTLFAPILFASPSGWANESEDWVSLYSGREANFSKSDRAKVLKALESQGIEFKTDSQRQILISRSFRSDAVDIVSQTFTKVTLDSEDTTTPTEKEAP